MKTLTFDVTFRFFLTHGKLRKKFANLENMNKYKNGLVINIQIWTSDQQKLK